MINTKWLMFGKLAIWGMALFVLFYFEKAGGPRLTVSVIWKFFLIILLFVYVINRPFRIPSFLMLSYCYCIKSFLAVGVFDYPYLTIVPVLGWVALPLFFHALKSYLYNVPVTDSLQHYQINPDRVNNLELYFKFLLFFFSFSCIPFFIGLEPYTEVKTLAQFGFDYDLEIFKGFYQNMHNAAGTLSIVSVCLFFLGQRQRKFSIKLLYYGFAMIAVFALYKTYVRTGILMFVVGMVVTNYNFILKSPLRLITCIAISILLLLYFSHNDVFMARLFDERIHGNTGDYRDIGSGRLYIWQVNLTNLFSSNLWSILLGFGIGLSTQLMYESAGFALISHSGFVDALVQNGIIGFIIFISYLILMKKHINTMKNLYYYPILNATYFMYLVFQLVQGGNQFMFVLLFAILLALSSCEKHNLPQPSRM